MKLWWVVLIGVGATVGCVCCGTVDSDHPDFDTIYAHLHSLEMLGQQIHPIESIEIKYLCTDTGRSSLDIVSYLVVWRQR